LWGQKGIYHTGRKHLYINYWALASSLCVHRDVHWFCENSIMKVELQRQTPDRVPTWSDSFNVHRWALCREPLWLLLTGVIYEKDVFTCVKKSEF